MRVRVRRSRLRTAAGALAVLLTLALAAGCGSNGDPPGKDRQPGKSEQPPNPTRTPHDPPLRFDPQSARPMPAEASEGNISAGGDLHLPMPVALHGTTAYVVASDGMQVVDTDTGQVRTVIRPERKPLGTDGATGFVGDNLARPPLVTQLGGKTLVLVPFAVQVAGHGTARDARAIELVAVDAGSNEPAWRAELPLPGSGSESSSTPSISLAGIGQNTLVLGVGDTLTLGMDMATRTPRWQTPGLDVSAVVGATVVGTKTEQDGSGDQSLIGLGVHDGQPRWQAEALAGSSVINPQPVASDSVLAFVRDRAGDKLGALVDVATGQVKMTLRDAVADGNQADGYRCDKAGTTLAVCYAIKLNEEHVFAVDTATGTVPWALPDAGRVAPQVTATRNGVVYGETKRGPIVLDTRTGADRELSPGVAPLVVNEYVGIGQQDGARLSAFRTAG